MMRTVAIIACALALSLLAGCSEQHATSVAAPRSSSSGSGLSIQESPAAEVLPANRSPSFQLAELDGATPRGEHDTVVNRFSSLLAQLSAAFSISEKDVSDYTVKCQELLHKQGIDETLLSLMEGFNSAAARAGKPSLRYEELCAAYITMRNKSVSREDALAGLALLKGREQ